MKNFYFDLNKTKPNTMDKAEELSAYIRSKGGKATISGEVPEDTDCIIVLGGDGTFLRSVKDYGKLDKPFLGINMGSLGFLTMTEIPAAFAAIDDLMADNYKLEHRMQLICVKEGHEISTALNDIAITQGGFSHLIGLEVYVNDQHFGTYEADGIIISTPTGSTGYNLSAAGPIVTPMVNAMIITPICPHSFNARSIIISGDDRVKIRTFGTKHRMNETAYVTVDGEDYTTMKPDDEVVIEKSRYSCKMCMLPGMSFIETLNTKMTGR